MPRRLALTLVILLIPAVSRAAAPKPPDLPIEAYRLPNGLKVVLSRDPTVPRVVVSVAFHVGSKDERAGRTGFAHFFEHMMFRGTKNVPNYDIPLQEAGAQTNAFTSEDMTVYFETVPENYLQRALYMEAERLAFLPSALDREKFATEREVVKNERRQSIENVPYGLASETLQAKVFPDGHPYSWSVIGSMKDLDASTTEDLKRFFGEFYHPGNATLCLVGDFDPEPTKKWIAEYFGPLAAGPARKAIEPPAAPAVALRVEQADDVQLPRVYWAWPTVADDHPDAPALDLLADVLAGGDASRLHKALVLDSRVAADVSASSDTKEAAGLFTLDATASEGKTTADVERLLTAEFARLRREPPTADELARALALFEKSNYAALTPPLGRAVALAIGFAQKDDPAYYRKDFARYLAVTPADLARVAAKYLVPEKVVLEIRPAKPGEAESPAAPTGPRPSPDDGAAGAPAREPKAGPDWTKLPDAAAVRTFQPPKIHRHKLSNGLDVWVAPWKTLPIVSARILIPAGTADDPEGKSGLAHLTATLLDKGTADLTATQLAEAFEILGVTPSVGVDPDTTTVGFSTVTRNLPDALGLVGRMLASPRFDEEDVARERQLQLTDLLQGPDDPAWIARRAFRALLFGLSNPYGNPDQGHVATVKALTAADVRSYHRAYFAPAGSTLIVVGDVDPAALAGTLEATLGTWKGAASRPARRPASAIKPATGVAYLVDKPGAVQSVLSVGRLSFDRSDPRYFAATIGNHVLGADFLSRLNDNLRVRNGFTYGAGSAFHFRKAGSVWGVNTSVRADATAPALGEVLSELDALAAAGGRPLTDEEIATARVAESRGFPEMFESPGSIAGLLEEMALHNLPADYPETYLDHLAAATPDQIREVLAEVVAPAARTVLVVGDRKAVEPGLKRLKPLELRPITPDGLPVSAVPRPGRD